MYNLYVAIVLGIITLITIIYILKKDEKLISFFVGFLVSLIIIGIINFYWFWYGNFMEEYDITTNKFNYFINKIDKKLSFGHEQKLIFKMTKKDIEIFFKNGSNFYRDRMEYNLNMQEDAVALADVVPEDKTYSMILLGYRHKTGFYDWLNWKDPYNKIFLINLCFYNPTNPDTQKIIDNVIKDEQLKNEIIDPPKGTTDVVLARYVTIVPSEGNSKGFKIRKIYFHPFFNYQAMALKALKDKYVKNSDCFYNN
jgi:energy-coupling factor transporter transmembrane protein EcfT